MGGHQTGLTTTANKLVFDINISQGSVTTCLRCGRMFYDHSIANILHSVKVKEFWKSVNTYWSYDKNAVAYFFDHSADKLVGFSTEMINTKVEFLWSLPK